MRLSHDSAVQSVVCSLVNPDLIYCQLPLRTICVLNTTGNFESKDSSVAHRRFLGCFSGSGAGLFSISLMLAKLALTNSLSSMKSLDNSE